MTVLLPPNYSKYLYYVSYFSLLSSFYAFKRKHYDLIIVPSSVFITSINYWRHPTYGYF